MTPCVEHAQKGRYARVRRNGRLVAQHVAVWEDAHGPRPHGWHVDHLCRNMRCIRLDHLEAVPAIVNIRRQRTVVLTLDLVRQIRAEYAELPRAERSPRYQLKTTRPVRVMRGARAALAVKYGLHVDHLKHVVAGTIWAD